MKPLNFNFCKRVLVLMWINPLMQFSVLCCVVLCWIITGPNKSHSRPVTRRRWQWHTCIYISSLCWVQDLKANESRLRDINKVASELESEGLMAEEAPVLQAQVPSSSCRRKLSTAPPSTRLTSLSPLPHVAAAGGAGRCSWQGALSLHDGHFLLDLWEEVVLWKH